MHANDTPLSLVPANRLVEATSEVMIVTPEMAREWLATMRYKYQRPLREGHVEDLVQDILTGRWRLSTIDLRRADGQWYLVNGQHRLEAIIRANRAVQMNVVWAEQPDMDEVAEDYAIHDRHLVRTPTDMLIAYGLLDRLSFTRTQLTRLSGAAPMILGAFRAGSMQRAARAAHVRKDFLVEWADTGLLANAIIGESGHLRVRKLHTAPVFAVALITLRAQTDRAERFWGAVANMRGLEQGHPGLALVDYIVETPIKASIYPYYARAVAACWNAYYENRNLRLVKVMDTSAPIRIAGTPYDGKRHLQGDDLPTEEDYKIWRAKGRGRETGILTVP